MARRHFALLLALAASLGACRQPPPTPPPGAIDPTRHVAPSPAEARAKVEAKLRELGFATRADNDASLTLVAERIGADDGAWAACPLAPVVDPDTDSNRRGFERPFTLRSNVVARFTTPAGRTLVSLDVLQVGRYRNPYVGIEFDERCRSTGALEALLLAAAA
ncbi:MAG: hypothetical protein AB7I59_01185 [Geminicoccaceae bacterium]